MLMLMSFFVFDVKVSIIWGLFVSIGFWVSTIGPIPVIEEYTVNYEALNIRA